MPLRSYSPRGSLDFHTCSRFTAVSVSKKAREKEKVVMISVTKRWLCVVLLLVALLIHGNGTAQSIAYADTLAPYPVAIDSLNWQRYGSRIATAAFPSAPQFFIQEKRVGGSDVIFEIIRFTDPVTGLFLNVAACTFPVEVQDPQRTLLELVVSELRWTESTILDESTYDPADPHSGIHLMSSNDAYIAHHRLMTKGKQAVAASAYVPKEQAEMHLLAHRFLDTVELRSATAR